MPTDLYKELEVTKEASAAEIKKQYRKLSLIYHPDKAPPDKKDEYEAKFKTISNAYEILSDEEKRKFYDMTGSVEQGGFDGGRPGAPGNGFPFPGGPGMPFPFDINNLFGMFNGGRPSGPRPKASRRPGKAPARKTQMPFSLKDFYYGRTLHIHLDRQRFCTDCKGEGAKNKVACSDCNGSGIRRQIIQMGPMIVDNTGPCNSCSGSGKTKGEACSGCNGSKFHKQDKELELVIQKGMKPGDEIVFAGESSNVEDYEEAGDVIIELVAADEDHDWERVGDTLRHNITLKLGEALCGCTVKLDGHPAHEGGLWVQIPAGVQNRQEIVIEGCGMPRQNTNEIGNAVLTIFIIPTPEERQLLEVQKEALKALFKVPVMEGDVPPIVWQAKPLQY